MKSDWSAGTPCDRVCNTSWVTRVARATAVLVVLAGLAVWLGGAALGVPLQEILADLQASVVARSDPWHADRKRLRRDVEAARLRVEEEARSLARLSTRIRAVEQTIAQQQRLQQTDRLLLSGLQDELLTLGERDRLTLDGRTWTRADLEHEARLILNRYCARDQFVDKVEEHRTQLGQTLEFWRDAFRKHRGNLNELGFQKDLACALLESQKITDDFDPGRWQRTERAIAGGQHAAAQAIEHCEARLAEQQYLREWHYARTTPAAEAIRLDAALEPPLEAQIQELLDNGK